MHRGDRMELENMIYEQFIRKLGLDTNTLDDFTYDTLLFKATDDSPALGLDSIDALDLVTLIYDNWQIDVPHEDYAKLSSVNAIAEYIRNFKEEV